MTHKKLQWPGRPVPQKLPPSVSKPSGFRLPDLAKRRPSNLKSRQNSALGARRHVVVSLPTLSILKDEADAQEG